MPIHPPGRVLAETLEENRELVLLADELGFTEGYIGEHITDAAENITSALIFIAWLLRETKRIRLGTGTINLPNHHPAMVAAEVALLDHMAKGRFLFGISPGGLPSDAEVRQPGPGPHRDVRRSNRPDPRHLERRGAVQPRGRVLDRVDRAHADPRARPGHHRQTFPRSRTRRSW
jgi:alkanesulfonate monooxygenase SsuD/methylene tetrahydromethanopterin reductase-like flavin-dependent oxidoreductase (luciferase family)